MAMPLVDKINSWQLYFHPFLKKFLFVNSPNTDATAVAGAGWGLENNRLMSSWAGEAWLEAPECEKLQSFQKLALGWRPEPSPLWARESVAHRASVLMTDS